MHEILENFLTETSGVFQNFEPINLLQLPFIIRIVFAIILFAIGYLGRKRILASLPKKVPKHIYEEKDFYEDFVYSKSRYLYDFAWVLGYFLLPGKGPAEHTAYTLSMAIPPIDDGGLWLEIIIFILIVLLVVTTLCTLYFRLLAGGSSMLYPWFIVLQYISVGMLFLYVVEGIARLIDLAGASGGFFRLVFSALILLQIIAVAKHVLFAIYLFLASPFSKKTLQKMDYDRKVANGEVQLHSSGGGGGGSSSSSNSPKKSFPVMINIGGEVYRLANDSGDNATYYSPKTGVRKHLRETDLPDWD